VLKESSRASLLNELRSQILEIDLFHKIEQDENIIPKVKNLLHKLANSFLEPKFVQFAIGLEPILDQLDVDLPTSRDGQAKLADQIKCKDKLLAAIEDSKKRIDNFKEERSSFDTGG